VDTVIASVSRACTPDAVADAARRVLASQASAADPFGRAVLEHRSDGAAERSDLATANEEAMAHLADGDATTAVSRLTGLAAACAGTLGSHHPDTLVVRGNLAAARVAAGQHLQAIADAQAVLDDRERVLGPHHPSTVNAGLTLGMAHLAAGDAAAAVTVLDTAMTVIERLRHGEHKRHRDDDHPLGRFCGTLLAEARRGRTAATA
jgi:Tetratricopeptide repeat